MIVSTSKLTFCLIAVAALLVSGSGFMMQDAFGLAAPTFTATHLNTTATKITFDQNVNGTLYKLDWTIKALSCAAPCTTNTAATAGDSLTDFTINDILNGTASGLVLNSDGTPEANGDPSYNGLQVHTGQPGQGFINHTAAGTQIPTVIVLIHAAIPSDATYFINYTGNAASAPEATSNAILANDNLQKDLIDLRKIGNFFYELSPGKLSERLMNLSDQDSGNRRLKLVLDSSNQLQVTDGSIIILFKNSSESSQVGSDYNLSVKRNLLPINTVVYYVDSFKNIENIITKLRADPRILDVSLDLINPRVSAE